MQFIEINGRYISISDILSAHRDYVQSEYYCKDLPDGGYESGNHDVHYVSIVTREVVDGTSKRYKFQHDTPEAAAILAWLEPRSTKLLK